MTDALERLRAALQGRYRVDREVGAGGMATVYLAYDAKHGREVAIKVLLPDLAAAVGSDRFLREIKVTSTLQHPHILPLYDSGEVDGLVYYVMPFVEGESLRARLDRVKQLPVREALDIARAVASALDYAHRRNVVHRDIKPENILLGTDGQHAMSGLQAVVADFGVAVAVASADKARLTASGVAVGTPGYMSPEQASAEPGLGPASDVYALGAVLYEMLIGEPPFTGPTAQAILARSASESPVAPQLRRPTVSTAVDRAIMTALAKVPTDRFASAGSFAEALQTGEHITPTAAPRRRSQAAAAFPWALAGVLAFALVMQVTRRPAAAPGQALVKSTLLAPPGEEFSDRHNFGALSRDGRHFAFVIQPERGAARLWVRNMDELTAQPLAGTEGASAPFWSPDGRSIAFFADGQLRSIAANGGAPVVIADAGTGAAGTWGPGNLIYFSSPDGIVRVSAEEPEQPELVFRADSGLRLYRPSIGDDPDYILLSSGLGELLRGDTRDGTLTKLRGTALGGQLAGSNAVLYVDGANNLMLQRIDLARGEMVGEPYDLGGPVRSAGTMMSFATSMSGSAAFLLSRASPGPVVVDRRGSVVDTIRVGFIASVGHGLSALALGSDSGLHRYDVQLKRSTRIHRTSGVTVLAWSPDDSRIAFSESCSLAVIEPSGSGLDRFPHSGDSECLRVTDWWSDDRVLVNKTVDGRPSEIWEYRINEGTASPVVVRDVAAIDGTVSPDGQLLAYALEENGTFDVFVRPLREVGPGERISLEGARAPRWRGDGRELYFVTAAGDVMAADVTPGPRSIGAPKLLFRATGWERSFFRDSRFRPFDVSGDGNRFYLSQSRIEGPAVLLQNLHSVLRGDPPPRP